MRYRCCAFILFLCFPFVGKADTTNVDLSKINPNMSLQLYAGLGLVNGQQNTDQAISFRVGYKDWFLTGRMYRQGETIFENSWMAGYRLRPHRNVNIIASVGFSDIAFIKDPWFRPHGDYHPSYYKKYYGISGEIEAEYQFHVKEKATAWGIASSYYYCVNGWRNLGIFSVGIKFHLLPLQQASLGKKIYEDNQAKKERNLQKRELIRQRDPVEVPKHQLRIKVGLSVMRNIHIEYEHKLRDRVGIIGGLGMRYSPYSVYYFLYEVFMGPDLFTKGAEVYSGVNYLTTTGNGWWSLGLKAGFGHFEGSGFYAYYWGTYRTLNRSTEEIKLHSRFAYTWGKQHGMNFTVFASTGAKVYYAQTKFNNYVSTPTHQGFELVTEKEWNIFPSVQMGFQLGVGW